MSSESKAALMVQTQTLRQNRDELFLKLARLLGYIHDMQGVHPELDWPELPDRYPEGVWRNAGL